MDMLLIGLALGGLLVYFGYHRWGVSKKKERIDTQSVILLEKIRNVCKLITVEGDFSEIYHYENVKEKWFKLLKGRKKALILIEAKAHIGFDLTKVKMRADKETQTVYLTDFPLPEVLSVETDLKYYDKKEGWANPFTASDLTEITSEAKNHIVDKIPGSGLLIEASEQALDAIRLMEQLVETINWKIDYSALNIDESKTKLKPPDDDA